jgi:hypothetical protein
MLLLKDIWLSVLQVGFQVYFVQELLFIKTPQQSLIGSRVVSETI